MTNLKTLNSYDIESVQKLARKGYFKKIIEGLFCLFPEKWIYCTRRVVKEADGIYCQVMPQQTSQSIESWHDNYVLSTIKTEISI